MTGQSVNSRGTEAFALGVLVLAAAFSSTNLIVARMVVDFAPPLAMAFGRWFVVALVLLPFCYRDVWRHRAAIGREWLDLLVLSLTGMSLIGVGPFFAARTTNAANMGLIFTFAPIAIVLCSRLFTRERMSPMQMAGIVLGFLGVVTIISHGDPEVILGLKFVAGDLWMLLAGSGWVVYSLLLKGRPSVLPDTVRLFVCAMVGALLILPVAVGEAILVAPPRLDLPTVSAMVFVALVPSLLAYRMHAYTTVVLGTGRTAVFSYLAPLFGVLFAWLILSEPVLAHHWLGGAAILFGVWLTSRPRRAA